MKNKFGILSSIIIVLTAFFYSLNLIKNKTKPVEDIFEVYPTDQVIKTNEMIFIEGIDEVNPGNIDLNDEEELEKLVRKQYEQNQKGK